MSKQTIRLVGPNVITQETDAVESQGIYEMRTYTFHPAGVQVIFYVIFTEVSNTCQSR